MSENVQLLKRASERRQKRVARRIPSLRFKVINNHICLDHKNGYYIIDTGSPISFAIGLNSHTIQTEVGDVFLRKGRFDATKVASLLNGIVPAGLLGMNAFHGGLHMAYDNEKSDTGYIRFSPRYVCNGTILSVRGNVPCRIKLTINGVESSAVIDTGAYLPYISEKLATNLESTGSADDYLGRIDKCVRVPTYDIEVGIGDKSYKVKAGHSPEVDIDLNMTNCDFIFSPLSLGIREFSLDFGRGSIRFR